MRSLIIISIGIFLIFITNCSNQIDLDAERAALLQADKDWAHAAKEGSISGLTTYWADDAVNYFPGQPVAKGKEEIIELVKRNRSQPGFSLTWEPNNAVVSKSADLGYTSGAFQLSVQGSEGKPVERSGYYVCIWKKVGGTWKCSVESTIFGPPPEGVVQGDDEGARRKAMAEHFFRGIYGGDPSVVDELATDDIEISYPIFQSIFGKPSLRGRQEVRDFASGFGQRWADPQISIEETIGAADRVVIRWSYQAREVGSRPGGPPPTNQVHRWTGMTIYRFDSTGKIFAEFGEESQPTPVERVGSDNGKK